MKLFWITIIGTFIFTLTGCSQPKELPLNQLQNADGTYEFTELPFKKSVADIQESLNLTQMEPALTHQGSVTYSLPDLYQYNGIPVQTNLEFQNDQLQMVSFTMKVKETEKNEIYDRIQTELVNLYGEPADIMDKKSSSKELNELSLSTKSAKWLTFENETPSSILQLTMTSSDRSQPAITIGVGIIP